MTYQNVQSVWKKDVGGGIARNFVTNVTTIIPQSRIRYIPSVAETLKFGWIQYLSM